MSHKNNLKIGRAGFLGASAAAGLLMPMRTPVALVVALHASLALGSGPAGALPSVITGPVSIRLVDEGAILVEDFDSPKVNETRWRVWQDTPTRSTVRQEMGRLNITAHGETKMEGLRGLTTAKYKDVVLVGEMDIRTVGSAPHRLVLHICGSDGSRSPDHWVEIQVTDLGNVARFSPDAALPTGLDRRQSQFIEIPHPKDSGFLCRIVLNGDTNRTELAVKTPSGWRQICDPIDLPLRTIHTEVKLHDQNGDPTGEETTSQAWFDNVRIYPRPDNHYLGIRLVRTNGRPAVNLINGNWPPKFVDPEGRLRPVEDIEVQLWTADGKQLVSAVRSPHSGFYLLPLKNAPWDVYPVPAELRLLLDGKPFGKPIAIVRQGLNGLYPDQVYEVVMQ